MSSKKDSNLVYSTEIGSVCPHCEKPQSKCSCQTKRSASSQTFAKTPPKPKQKRDGIVRIGRETKGRKGKGVTTITGLPLTLDEIKGVAKELKQKCGTGGTVKDGVIEIQGDHRDALLEELTKRGYTVKRSGG